jgi:hypothetical protein
VNNGLQTLSGSRDTAVLLWSIEKFNPTPKVEPKVAPPAYAPIELKPTSVVQVNGTVGKMILSPNKKWLFYLDVSNGVLGQIDAATGKLKKTLKADAQLMALSDDGKTLFAAGFAPNAILGTLYVVDPVTFELRNTNEADLVPFALSLGAGDKVFMTGAGNGFTSVAMFDSPQAPVKYIAPIKGDWQMLWLPGKLVVYPNTDAKEFEVHKLPIDPSKIAPERVPIAQANPFSGPPLRTLDGKFLISRTGTVLNASDLKPNGKIDPFLSLAVDVEANSAHALNDKGWLKQYSYPDWKEVKKWKLPITAYQIAVDAKGGKMYLSVVDPEAIRSRPRAKGFGDVWVLEMKELK